jgi:hypothetical protein
MLLLLLHLARAGSDEGSGVRINLGVIVGALLAVAALVWIVRSRRRVGRGSD